MCLPRESTCMFLSQECRKLGVQCIVAPYEADAQLAYLSKEDIVDVVITEDSDLLVFGSKRVFFKMDESGNGKLIELKDLGRANKNLIVRREKLKLSESIFLPLSSYRGLLQTRFDRCVFSPGVTTSPPCQALAWERPLNS